MRDATTVTDPDPEKEPCVVMPQHRYHSMMRNYLDHADQARDYWQHYVKAKEAMLALANEIECERPCDIWVDRIRNAFPDISNKR
jgi:hypothetical protein